ncbi:FtsJ-like methyltransferase [Fragilaria crotonensis]|nr:FtsJ-like methyltransferase [Fragilaria crotonensis]
MSLYRIHPPSPQTSIANENSLGHRLLGLVKAAEKDSTLNHSDLSLLLELLCETYHRKGLLGGDNEKADKILASGGKASSSNLGRNKKGDASKNGNKHGMTPEIDATFETQLDSGSAIDDTNLLLSALVRLVGGNHELSSLRSDIDVGNTYASLVFGGFQVCHAILQHMVSCRNRRESCALAEYELIAGVSRTLLTGSSRTVTAVLKHSGNDVTARRIMISAFRVATLNVSLYGIKLSRNQAILSSLQSLAWSGIAVPDECLQKSAGDLLAALALTGMNKLTPSSLWIDSSIDSIAALFVVLETAAPMKSKSCASLDVDKAHRYLSDSMTTILSAWLARLGQEMSPDARLVQFNALTSGLTQTIVSLLEVEFLSANDAPVLSSARFPVVELLDLLESMFAFPSAAENMYYGTKKRLRMEIIEGGLLSSTAIVNSSANHIKRNGLVIFNATMQSLGRSVLLPYGKRIIKLAHSSLQTSCSLTLRHAVDPTSSVRLDGKRKKWLHTSLEMRAHAMEAFHTMVCTIGSNSLVAPLTSDTGTKRTRASPAGKGVTLVVGCLLEQLSLDGDPDGENWGSTEEVVTLVCTAMRTISSILTQGAGYLAHSARLLIDSAIQCCIDVYQRRACTCVFASPEVKLAFLQLELTCMVTPWPDGASTSLAGEMRHATKILASDVDASVASQARSCLQLIECMNTPRCPPLLIATRGSNEAHFSIQQESAGVIVERLRVVRETVITNDATDDAPSKGSKGKKERKDTRLADGTDTAAKRTRLVAPAPRIEPTIESNSDPVMTIVEKDQVSSTHNEPTVTADDGAVTDLDQTVTHPSCSAVNDVCDDGDDLDDMMPGIIDAGPDDED